MKIFKIIVYKLISIFHWQKSTRKKYRELFKSLIAKKSVLCTYHSVFDFSYDNKKQSHSFIDYGAIDCRNISSIKMLSIAMSRINKQLNKSFKVRVVTGDFTPTNDEYLWAYARQKGQNSVELIPDFFFDNWISIGCNSYDDWMKQMVENSKTPPEFDAIFWSGALDMNEARVQYNELSKKDKRIICKPVLWKREEWVAYKQIRNDRDITLKDFPKYKYLIDLPCAGYSGRFKALLFSGRPVFKVDDGFEEFFYKDLQPFVHYIPVKNDLSDLIEKLEWAENNYGQAKEIASNAQEYALKNLTFEATIQYLQNLILRTFK